MHRTKLAAFGLLLFLAVLAAYSNHFENSFHFDDWHTVNANPYIRDIGNIPKFYIDARTFSTLPTHQTYRPVVSTTLAIDYRLAGGLNPAWFHIDTFVWFAALLAAMYFLYLRLMHAAHPDPRNGYVALFGVGLFGLHPVSAETVNYIVQRGDIHSTLGVVLGMALYIYWPAGRKWGAYLAPVVIGTLAKPPALMFMPILFVYIYLFESVRSDVKSGFADRLLYAGRASIPALATCAVLGVLQIVMTPATFASGAASAHDYWLTQPSVILHYVKSFFIPTELTADTDRIAVTSIFSETSVVSLALLALIAAALRPSFRRPEMRPAVFGVSWFLLALLPTSLEPLAELDNDHRMFFAYVGLTLAVTSGAFLIARGRLELRAAASPVRASALIVIALAMLTACGWGAYQRNIVWHSEESLWKDVTEKSPRNGRGLMNYGLVLMARGDYAGALAFYRRAETYTPNYSLLRTNEGIAYGAIGDDVNAEAHLRQGISLAPNDSAGYYHLARWLDQKKRAPEAIALLQRAVVLGPTDTDARYLLMQMFSNAGDAPNLNAVARDTLRLFPGDLTAAGFLAQGPRPAAASAALSKQPVTPEDFLMLSLSYEQAGKHEECITAATQALKLRPDYAEAYNNIAAAYGSMGRWDDAILAAEQAMKLKPDFQLAKNNLQYSLNKKRLLEATTAKAP